MAGIRTENKVYEVGMYCRLSKDDGTDNESASIATQKSILTDYVKKQGWHLAKTYVDDGYSGTNFQRPSFQNMIKDIESGVINCVITKDLSRLGRNYLDCGLYLEVFFPEHNVRYIAVNDGVDTLNKSAMDITPFRNILNEMYAADISVKIKSAFRARFQQGKYMATSAPYGYIKDPADHNHLLIDDKVAHIVREIFDLALQGYGIPKIRKHINKQHILRPAAYAAERGERETIADGTVRQEIKIYYKFIGFVGELHITPTKRWTALKPKNCTVCGVEYVPRSGISKYCPACAKKIQREKSNESKRRSRERNRQACIELSAKNDRLKWIFSMKDVLRTRREMFGLTQEQLCEGICSAKSLRRAEKGQTDMQRETLKKILNRLGLSGQMQWSRLITSDREVIRMAEELADYINDRKFSVASKQLESLKSRIDLDIPQNKQYFLEKQALLAFEQGKVKKEEFVKMEKEALECTLRVENLYRKENVYLTEREIICISNSWKGMEGKEKRESINLILRLYDNYALNNGLSQAISVYEIVTEAAVNELGNNGEHVRAEEIDRKSIKASLSCRRVWDIHYKIYDILWNEKELMKKSGKRVSNNRMNTELKRCIIMSHYVKRYFYENVYKEKLS